MGFSVCCYEPKEFFSFFIGVQLLYNVMLISAVPQSEPVISSVQFSHSVVSEFLQRCGSQHARPPCPSPTPGVYSDSRPLSQ